MSAQDQTDNIINYRVDERDVPDNCYLAITETGGDNSIDNHFAGPASTSAPTNEAQESNSGKEESALLSVNDEEKKKWF